jgi:putative ABC transport system permease protein
VTPNRLAARIATSLTRALLRLYPASFRNELGLALVADVRRRAEELTRTRAGMRVAAWLIRLGASLVANAFAVWREQIADGHPSLRWRRVVTLSSPLSWLDLKLAFRMLVKYPGLTLTGGLGIAVAIAIGVGFYALFHSRFYPTIPLSDGDRLVGLQNWDRRTGKQEHRSLHDFIVWRDAMQSVDDMTAFRTVARNMIAEDGSVDSMKIAEITPSGFRLARVPPLLGRSLVETDTASGAAPVIVIGFDVWRARFASDPHIVGRHVRLGRTVHTVVGVMPDGFAFPVNHRAWTPLQVDSSEYERGAGPSIFVSGRLAPGVTLDDAHAELTAIGKRMAAEFPDSHGFRAPEVLPYTYPFIGGNRNSADSFWAMSVLASLLLVVVCVNVAILIYARTATRLGEIAVRSALGASRARIVGQLFAESLVLSAGAAALGLGVVKMALDWARGSLATLGESTFWADYTLPASALPYFLALTVLAAVITGIIPALRATGRRVQSDLRQFHSGAGLRMGRTWTTLIVVQVAVASAALPLAVALSWFQVRDAFSVPRFPLEQILFAEVELEQEPPPGRDADTYRTALPARFARLQVELSHRLDAEPGIIGHAFMLGLPDMGRSARVAFDADFSPSSSSAALEAEQSTVDLNFFRTFDVGVLAGRAFEAADRDGQSADVVVVNRAFARRLPGGGDAIGRRLRYVPDLPQNPNDRVPERWYEIVGLVENIDANPFGQDLVNPRVYHPMKNVEGNGASLAVRIAGVETGSLAGRLPKIAAELDPALRIAAVPLGEAYRARRVALITAALGIGVALLSVVLLSAAGIYALMSFTVAQRRREIAIRAALGARSGRLVAGIFGHALRQIAVGVVLGVGAALLLDASADGEALGGQKGMLLSSTVLLMSVVGLVAVSGPARRGLQIAPSEALKGD